MELGETAFVPSAGAIGQSGLRSSVAAEAADASFARLRRLYEAILSNTPDLAYVWDLNHRFIYVNEGLLKMWGRTREDALGKNCLELGYEPWHAAMHDREIEQVVATGKPVRGEVPFTGTFGRRIYDYVLVPVFGPGGQVEAVAGTTRDVTEYRETQDQHRRHVQQLEVLNRVGTALAGELNLEKLVQTVTDAGRELCGAEFGVFFYNAHGRVGGVRTLRAVSGAAPAPLAQVSLPEDAPLGLCRFPGDGVVRISDISAEPAGRGAVTIGGVPITKLAVRSLLAAPVISRSGELAGQLLYGHGEPGVFGRESEPVLRALAAQAAVAIDNAQLHAGVQAELKQRKEAEAALGRQFARAALLSSTLQELLAAKDPERLVHELFPRVASNVGADTFFNFLVEESGQSLRLHACGGVEADVVRGVEKLEFGQAICGTVALRRQTIHATDIQNSDDSTSAFVRSLGMRAYCCNPLLVGDKLLGTLSFGSRTRSRFEPDEVEFLTSISQYVAISMERLQTEARLQRIVEERTRDLERSHARLRLSERMAALGTLAAGLGHDMGNLLMPIRVQLESIEEAGVPQSVREEVAGIRSGVEYLRKLASGLRLLAIDPGASAKGEVIELRSWWPEVCTLLKSALPRGVMLKDDIGDVRIRMARAAFTQVLFNLVQNAGDALRDRGAGTVRIGASAAGEKVSVTVSDDGPGMPEEVRTRCMEPFFTTKTRMTSTGLGLALVYGLVQQAGGSIELFSQPGKGTTFVIVFENAVESEAVAPKPETRPFAVLDVRDARLRAILASDLKHSFTIAGKERMQGAALCVTDNATVAGAGCGVTVLLADASEAPPGTVAVGRGARVETIREAVRAASKRSVHWGESK